VPINGGSQSLLSPLFVPRSPTEPRGAAGRDRRLHRSRNITATRGSRGRRPESEPSASIDWEPRAAAAPTSPRTKRKRLVAETRARRLTASCPSRPSAAALPHATFPPPARQAGGWSSRGSRWLSPPLRASPSAAAGSYELLAADGGTTATAKRGTEGRQPAEIGTPGSPCRGPVPRCHPAPVTPFPSAPDTHPPLPPLLS